MFALNRFVKIGSAQKSLTLQETQVELEKAVKSSFGIEECSDLLADLLEEERFDDIRLLINQFPWFYRSFRRQALSVKQARKLNRLFLRQSGTLESRIASLMKVSQHCSGNDLLGLSILYAGQAMKLSRLDMQSNASPDIRKRHAQAICRYARTIHDLGSNVYYRFPQKFTRDFNTRLLRIAIAKYQESIQTQFTEVRMCIYGIINCHGLLGNYYHAAVLLSITRAVEIFGLPKQSEIPAKEANANGYRLDFCVLNRYQLQLSEPEKQLYLLIVGNRFGEIPVLLKELPELHQSLDCYKRSFYSVPTWDDDLRRQNNLRYFYQLFERDQAVQQSKLLPNFKSAAAYLSQNNMSMGLAMICAGEAARLIKESLKFWSNPCYRSSGAARQPKMKYAKALQTYAEALQSFGTCTPYKTRVLPFQRHSLKIAIAHYNYLLRKYSDCIDVSLIQVATTECHVTLGQYFQAGLVQPDGIVLPIISCYSSLSVLGLLASALLFLSVYPYQITSLGLIVSCLLALFSAAILFITVAQHKRKNRIMLGALIVFSAPTLSLLLSDVGAWLCCSALSILMLCLSSSMIIAYLFCTSPGRYLNQKQS